MTRNSLTVFYIEELQPDWLPSHHQQWLLRIGRSIVVGLVFGLVFGFIKGGHTCIQHVLIRWMLTRNGSAPWRYAAFLDYAAERILLRKVGGYTFIHRYLRDYFASLESVGPTQAAIPSSSDSQTS
jgi:hypothetical protein